MLEVLATDTFLGVPFGLVKVQIPIDDPRKRRLEDPASRVKGLSFGLKARGIFRTKKSMKTISRNGRKLKHVIVRGLRTSQQEWAWRVRRKKLLPADYQMKKKRQSTATKRKASEKLLQEIAKNEKVNL
eukprot:g1772.t1